jgi:hypothetical protein
MSGRLFAASQLVSGAILMGYLVAGLFFLRFWRDTRDRLFGLFALAFAILAANRVGLALLAESDARGDHLYWVRLLAFTVILVAIWDKNRPRGRRDGRPGEASGTSKLG